MDEPNIFDLIVKAVTFARTATTSASQPTAAGPTLRLRENPNRRHLRDADRWLDLIEPTMRAAIRGCVIGASPWPLLLWGPAGTGKTCAALCLLDHCPHGADAWYGSLSAYARTFGSMLIDPEAYDRKLNEWNRAELVVVDEIGARQPTDHQYELLVELMDNRGGKPAVYISNLGYDEIAEVFDHRVASRLFSGTVHRAIGGDRRLRT